MTELSSETLTYRILTKWLYDIKKCNFVLVGGKFQGREIDVFGIKLLKNSSHEILLQGYLIEVKIRCDLQSICNLIGEIELRVLDFKNSRTYISLLYPYVAVPCMHTDLFSWCADKKFGYLFIHRNLLSIKEELPSKPILPAKNLKLPSDYIQRKNVIISDPYVRNFYDGIIDIL